jgi:hypothetical protein
MTCGADVARGALARSLEAPVQNHSTPVPTYVQKRRRQVFSPSCEAQLKHWLLFASHIRRAGYMETGARKRSCGLRWRLVCSGDRHSTLRIKMGLV